MFAPQTLAQDESILRANRDDQAQAQKETGSSGNNHDETPFCAALTRGRSSIRKDNKSNLE